MCVYVRIRRGATAKGYQSILRSFRAQPPHACPLSASSHEQFMHLPSDAAPPSSLNNSFNRSSQKSNARALHFFLRSAQQQLDQHRNTEKNAEFRAAAKRTAGVRVGARSQLHMVVVRVLPLDIADGIARRAEGERVGVDVVGNARGPVVCSLCVAGLAPMVAAVV